jgi:hypothetical protein
MTTRMSEHFDRQPPRLAKLSLVLVSTPRPAKQYCHPHRVNCRLCYAAHPARHRKQSFIEWAPECDEPDRIGGVQSFSGPAVSLVLPTIVSVIGNGSGPAAKVDER